MHIYDLGIIGGGIAGISCAVQASRYFVNTVLFEGRSTGGYIRNAGLIENYPGLEEPLKGSVMVKRLDEQLKRLPCTELIRTRVTSLGYEREKKIFLIKSAKGVYSCRYLVAAVGTEPVIPEVVKKCKEECTQHIVYEVSDIYENNSETGIIGGGDAAYDSALTLGVKGEVTLFVRNRVTALPLLQRRVKCNEAVEERMGYDLISVKKGIKRNLRLEFRYKKDGSKRVFEFDKLLCATGRKPAELEGLEDLRRDPLIRDVFFEIGDYVNGIYRQASISGAQGVKTGMMIGLNIHRGAEK